MSSSRLIMITAVVCLFAGRVAAQETAVASHATFAREHAAGGGRSHEGFFLRLMAGGAGGGTSYEEAGFGGAVDRTRTLGAGSMTEVAVGWAVAPNLVVHANLHLAYLSGYKKTGQVRYEDEERVDTLVGFFGAGATYYFMPANVYVSGAIGPGGLSETLGHRYEDHESNVGFGSALSFGKEWWLGRRAEWGLGVALAGSYHRAPLEVDGVSSTFHGSLAGIALSATYN